MANPTTLDLAAFALNADSLRWNAWGLRHDHGVPPGEGVAGYEDWRVMQRQAGATMDVDVGATTAGLMVAWVRGDTRGGQGLYRVDNINRSAPTADTYKAQIAVTVSANASGNPRLDQVVLEVLDAQHTGASNTAQIRVVAGTATAGATLDNRTGAAALPSSALLLADILVPNGAASILTADIRDRRAFPLPGVVPAPQLAAGATRVDQVAFVPFHGVGQTSQTAAAAGDLIYSHNSHDTMQAAVLMFLPRRIVGATRLRWKYLQGATANTGNYHIGIYDSSGRSVVATGSVAFTGAAASYQVRSETISATTLDAGWYYVMWWADTATVGGSSFFRGVDPALANGDRSGTPFPNVALRVATAASAPTTLLGFTDVSSLTAATTIPPVPLVTLSVG